MSRPEGRQSAKPDKRRSKEAKPPASSSDGLVIHMKPQRAALVVLLLMFAAWLGLLLTIYFRTVHQPEDDATPSAAAASLAMTDHHVADRIGTLPVTGGPLITAR